VTPYSLYSWKRQFAKSAVVQRAELDQNAEIRRLKAELKRVSEERDILKKAAAYFAKGVRAKYAFMRDHVREFRLATMCRVLKVHRSGYYAWRRSPLSVRSKDDQRLLGLIKQQWLESDGV